MPKRKNLFIHIGMPKTGSSAIQAFLALNTDFLLKNNFQFPSFPGFGQAFQTSAGNAPQLHRWILEGDKNKFREMISDIESDNIILSSEVLFHTARAAPDKFVDYFKEYDFKIICYIRKIDDLIESCINQLIKNHELVDYSNISQILGDHDYATCLSKLSDYIDISDIVVKKYDKLFFNGDDIYSDFLSIISLDKNDLDITYPNNNVNPSLNRDALEFRILLNIISFNNNDDQLKYGVNGLLARYSVDNKSSKINLLSSDQTSFLARDFKPRERLLNKLFFNNSGGIFNYEINSELHYEGLSDSKMAHILTFIYENDSKIFFHIIEASILHSHLYESQNIIRGARIVITDRIEKLPDSSDREKKMLLNYVSTIIKDIPTTSKAEFV